MWTAERDHLNIIKIVLKIINGTRSNLRGGYIINVFPLKKVCWLSFFNVGIATGMLFFLNF